jgi:Clostripain family
MKAKTAKPKKAPAKPVTRDWTLMVYLCGDNNLSSAGAVDLNEMKKVGSNDRINVVAQYDRAGHKVQTMRYYLRKRTSLADDVVARIGETNMGDPKVLEDFVVWATTAYPARHYLLVIWNHGAGWDDANLYEGDVFSGAAPPVSRKQKTIATSGGGPTRGRAVPLQQARAAVHRAHRALFRTTVAQVVTTRGIAFDDDAKDFLDNVELKRVLARLAKRLKRKFDILGMDACLMSMAEVSYQLRDVAELTVGSQEEEPGDGWPYDRILRALAAKPSMSARDLAKAIVREYVQSYGSNEGITQAAVDLGRIGAVTHAVDGLSRALRTALGDASARDAIIAVRGRVQEYTSPYDDYVDITDLCTLLKAQVVTPAVRTACTALVDAVSAAVVAEGSKGSRVAHSHGLSIYFPKRTVSPLYGTLDFTKDSTWDEFVGAYLAALRR